MKRRWGLIFTAASLAVLLALAFIYPSRMISPGALIPEHASLETDCFACHAPLRGAVAERCITCHAAASIGLRTTEGIPIARTAAKTPYHQALTTQDCMACHSDHPRPRLTALRRMQFSHALVKPEISANCMACHTAPSDALHRDLKAACSQCHSQDHWKPATFDHNKYFELDRDHNTTCTVCHSGNDYRRYTCFGCHEHQPEEMRKKHIEEGIRNFENCVSCHRNAHDEPDEKNSREHDDDD